MCGRVRLGAGVPLTGVWLCALGCWCAAARCVAVRFGAWVLVALRDAITRCVAVCDWGLALLQGPGAGWRRWRVPTKLFLLSGVYAGEIWLMILEQTKITLPRLTG